MFKRFVFILCFVLSFSVFGSAAGQHVFPLVIKGTLANGYSWKTSLHSLGCSLAFTSVQESPLLLGYERASCPGNSFAREDLGLLSPDGTLVASAQLTPSVPGPIWIYPANPGDVIAIVNDNDIAVNVAAGSNVVTIPPHSGLYDVLDNVLHGAYRGSIRFESYGHPDIYLLGLRYTPAGFMIIQPDAYDEEPAASSSSSSNTEQCSGDSCNGPGQTGNTPGQGGENPGQGNANGNGSNNAGGNGSNGSSGECPGNSCNAPGHTGNTPGQGGENPGQGNANGNGSNNAGGDNANNGGNNSNSGSGECPGNSCNAPGHTGNTPGQGGENPGQGNANGNNNADNNTGNSNNSGQNGGNSNENNAGTVNSNGNSNGNSNNGHGAH